METIKFENKGNIKMIAHRGVSGLETENTCPAFVVAGVKSYYGIETDVHLTKDGKFLVGHDESFARVADVDVIIEETNFEELRKIRIKDKDGSKVRADLFPPSLEEYICICKKYEKQAILEIKGDFPKEKVWEMVEQIKTLGWYERTTFISFYLGNLLALRERYPDSDVQCLFSECEEKEIQFMIDNKMDADLCGYCLTPEKVQKLHAHGLKVNVWTLDTLEHANMAKLAGVDFITSNILE